MLVIQNFHNEIVEKLPLRNNGRKPSIHFTFRTIHLIKKPFHKKFISDELIQIYFWTRIDSYPQ